MICDPEPFYRDDSQETGTQAPRDASHGATHGALHGALHYAAGGGGWRLGDIDLREVLARTDGYDAPILVGSGGQIYKVTVQWTCDVCGCPLDDVGVCPRCQLHAVLTASRLRAQRQRKGLLLEIELEIEQIVEAHWQG